MTLDELLDGVDRYRHMSDRNTPVRLKLNDEDELPIDAVRIDPAYRAILLVTSEHNTETLREQLEKAEEERDSAQEGERELQEQMDRAETAAQALREAIRSGDQEEIREAFGELATELDINGL